MKIKRRKKLNIKRRRRVTEKKSRHTRPPADLFTANSMGNRLPADRFIAHRVCKTFDCIQAVYMPGEEYCYYCDKKRRGLIA